MSLHFIRPEWFWALIPLAIVLYFFSKKHPAQSSWNRYIAPHLAANLLDDGSAEKKSHLPWLAASGLVAIIALAGPALYQKPLPVFASSEGRVVLMDMSLSMYSTDITPNRLTQARFRATDLLNSIKDGETGLIAYAGDAFVISPLTRDNNTLLNLLPTLSPEIMPVLGSNLPKALAKAKTLLAQGGHISGDIILLTDGVNTEQLNDAQAELSGTQYRLDILALGTRQGAPIKLPNGQLMRDSKNDLVVPTTDFNQLNTLANASGGKLFPYVSNGADLNHLRDWLQAGDDAAGAKATELAGDTWIDLGPYLALVLLIPLLLAFRVGLPVMAALILPLSLGLMPKPASASTWDDLWQTHDQQAAQAYNQGDYKNAASQFDNAAWQGAAKYKAGDYQGALQAFEQDKSAQGFYNQGNALMQLGKYEEASKRYNQALAQDPNMPEAKVNKALAEKLEQQQKQQQKNQQDNKDNKQQDQNDKSKNDDPSKNDDKSQQNDQSKNNDQQQQGDSPSGQNKQQGSNQSQNGDKQPQNGDKQNSKDGQQQQEGQQGKNDQQHGGNQQQQDTAKQQQAGESPQQSGKSADDAKPQAAPKMQADTGSAQQPQDGKQADDTSAQSSAAAADKPQPQAGDKTDAQMVKAKQANPDDLPEDMRRALKAVVDDPAALLRNKMELEYQKRRQRGQLPKEQQQW